MPTAGAHRQAYFVKQFFDPVEGVRVTVHHPDSSQKKISELGDFLLTSVWALEEDGPSSGMQQGVMYAYKVVVSGGCALGRDVERLFFFTEIVNDGVYDCGSGLTTSFATSHLQAAVRGMFDRRWHGYVDSAEQTTKTNAWTQCGGNACSIYAFGEEGLDRNGLWYAKFAGSGHTPWQYWNGSWNPVGGPPNYVPEHACWSQDFSGPFPTGIYSFSYNCLPTSDFYAELPPADDTYVYDKFPLSEFGSETYLQVSRDALPSEQCCHAATKGDGAAAPTADNIRTRRILLRFVVPPSGTITTARLRLCPLDTSPVGGDVHALVDADPWDEDTMNWNSQPGSAADVNIGSIGPVVAGTCTEIDVTNYVWTAGSYTFRIDHTLPIPQDVRYTSKEGAPPELIPRLIVDGE